MINDDFNPNTNVHNDDDVLDIDKESGDFFSPLPEGIYRLLVEEALFKTPNDPSKPDYLNVKFKVVGSQHGDRYNNRVHFEIFNVNHAKSQVRAIAKNQLANLCVAANVAGKVSMSTIDRTLRDKFAYAKLVLQDDDYRGGKRNRVQKYLAPNEVQDLLGQQQNQPAAAPAQGPADIPF